MRKAKRGAGSSGCSTRARTRIERLRLSLHGPPTMRCSIVPSSPTLTAAPPTTVHAALGRSSRVVPSVRGECSHRARGGEHAAETETVGRGLKGQRQPHDVTYRTAPACVACTKARGSTVTISGNTVMIAMATTGDAERGGFGGGGVARHDHPDHQHDQQRAGD